MPAVKTSVAFLTVLVPLLLRFLQRRVRVDNSQDQNISATMSIRSLFSKSEKVTKSTCRIVIRTIKPLK